MSTFWVFVNFLEDGNKYKAKIFRVYSTFNKVSNGISHFVVAQNFVIYTCLRMATDIVCIFLRNRIFVQQIFLRNGRFHLGQKISTGQLSCRAFQPSSEGAFLVDIPVDLFRFFKHQDMDSSSI